MYRPTFENLKTVLTKLHLKDAARTWRKHCCMMGELDFRRFSKGCSETVIVTQECKFSYKNKVQCIPTTKTFEKMIQVQVTMSYLMTDGRPGIQHMKIYFCRLLKYQENEMIKVLTCVAVKSIRQEMMPKVNPHTLSLSPLCRSPSKILNRLTFWAIMGNTKNGNRCIKWHLHNITDV